MWIIHPFIFRVYCSCWIQIRIRIQGVDSDSHVKNTKMHLNIVKRKIKYLTKFLMCHYMVFLLINSFKLPVIKMRQKSRTISYFLLLFYPGIRILVS
jgi:hypothetical protein